MTVTSSERQNPSWIFGGQKQGHKYNNNHEHNALQSVYALAYFVFYSLEIHPLLQKVIVWPLEAAWGKAGDLSGLQQK